MFEDARSLNTSTTAVQARPPRIGSGNGWEWSASMRLLNSSRVNTNSPLSWLRLDIREYTRPLTQCQLS